MTNTKQLEQELNKRKNKYGLVGAKPARVQAFDDADYNISAQINPVDWGIEVNIRTGYKPIQDERQKIYARVKKIKDGLETVVLQLGSGHEVAHWELPLGSGKGCPFDTYHHDKILEAIKQALPENKQEFSSYVANMFEDTMINPRVKEYFGDFSGQILFWDGEGLRCEEQTGKKGFTALYEAFVKVNLHLFGDRWDKAFMKRHYTSDSKVETAVKRVITDLNLPENISDTTPLFNKTQWTSMAEKYAKAISDLLDDEIPQERLSAYGSGQPQDSDGKPEKRTEQKPKPGNGIEQKVQTKEGKEEVAFGRYSHNEKLSPNIETLEQLDLIYQRLAKDIPVKVEAVTRESSMEISPLNCREFDPEKDNPSKIKTSKLFFNRGGVSFAYPNQPLAIDYKQKIQRKSFPNFKMVLVDCSGSMREGIDGNSGSSNSIPWGDNSKYHWALMGYYGIEKFLQEQGISPYIEHGVSLFSDNTCFEKGNYQDLTRVRKLLLSPDWGSTNIDAKVLKQALNGEGSFLVSLSDGEIGNWTSEKEAIRKLAEQNHFAHVQIGPKTQVTKDLESWGMPVFYVNSGEDLTKLMVNVAKDAYHPFVQQTKQ